MQSISVIYETGAQAYAQKLFGSPPPDETLARLAGALDGAQVCVSVRRVGLFLAVTHPWFECYETSVRRDADGGLFAYLHDVRKRVREPQRVIARAFSRQVAAARELGLKRFELYAAGYAGDTKFSGYRVWPQYGFNAQLYREERRRLPLPLADAKDLNQLMSLPGGYDWWKEKGNERSMVFDLSDDSGMMRVLRDYLNQLGQVEE